MQTFFSLGDRDVGVFAYIGERIATGAVPYRDVWDHKTPLIYFLNAALFNVFGASFTVIAIFEIVWLTFTAYALYKLARVLMGELPACFATGIFAIYVGSTYLSGSFGMTETYALLPTTLAVYFCFNAYVQKRVSCMLLSGIMTTVAFLFRQTAGIIGIVILLYILCAYIKDKKYAKQSRAALQMYVIGGLLPIIVVLAYFYLHDSVTEFLSQVFVFNLVYSDGVQVNFLHNLATLVHELVYTVGRWPLIVVLSIVGVLSVLVESAQRDNQEMSSSNISFGIFIFVWFVADLFAITFSGEFYRHYFVQFTVSASLLSGIVVKEYFNSDIQNWRTVTLFGMLCLFCTPLLSTLDTNLRFISHIEERLRAEDVLHIKNGSYITDQKERIEWILKNTTEDDAVYFWGAEARLNFLTDRLSPTKFVYTYPLFLDGYVTATDVNHFLANIKENNPRFIIDTSSTNRKTTSFTSEGIQSPLSIAAIYIRENYVYKDELGEWIVYELKN